MNAILGLHARRLAPVALALALALAGCAQSPKSGGLPGLPGLPDLSALPKLPGLPAAAAAAAVAGEPSSPAAAAGAEAPMVKSFTVTPEQVKAMMIRADPQACAATADAGGLQIARMYGKLALSFAAQGAVSSLDGGGASAMKSKLSELRPVLRDLSRQVHWMPKSAERLIGDRFFAMNKLKPYKPVRAQAALVEGTVKPVFAELARYAKEGLKSEFVFDLRLVDDQGSHAPYAMPGGIIVVPSGFLQAVAREPQPEQMIAFTLAHEFSHVLRSHKTKMLQLMVVDGLVQMSDARALLQNAKFNVANTRDLSSLLALNENTVGPLATAVCVANNLKPALEQNQELEADVCAALLLHQLGQARKASYDPVAGYETYVRLNPAGGGLAEAPEGIQPAAGRGRAAAPAGAKDAGKTGGGAMAAICPTMESHPQTAQRLDNLKAYVLPAPGRTR